MATVDSKNVEEEVDVPQKTSEAGDMEDPILSGSESDDLKKEVSKVDTGDEVEEEEEDGVYEKIRQLVLKGLFYAFLVLIVVYLLAAFIIDFERATALFVCTVLVIVYNVYAFWAKNNEEAMLDAEDRLLSFLEKSDTDWKYGGGLASLLVVIMTIVVAVTVKDGRNLISLFGLVVFLALTWIFSWKPSKVRLRPVLGGIFIQFIFGYCVIRTTWGFDTTKFLADTFTTLLGYTYAGSLFVFNWLADGSLFAPDNRFVQISSDEETPGYSLGPPFFFNVLPSVIFFSSLMSVGYYLRVLPWLVRKFGTYISPNVRQTTILVSFGLISVSLFSSQDTVCLSSSGLRRPSLCRLPETSS